VIGAYSTRLCVCMYVICVCVQEAATTVSAWAENWRTEQYQCVLIQSQHSATTYQLRQKAAGRVQEGVFHSLAWLFAASISSKPILHIPAQLLSSPFPISSALVELAFPPRPRLNTPWLIAEEPGHHITMTCV
jgi:hypothetical protein